MSLVLEEWRLVGRGIDRDTFEPFALIARNQQIKPRDTKLTTWKVQLTTNSRGRVDWRVVAMQYSNGEYRTYRGINLSHSQIDTILRQFAEA